MLRDDVGGLLLSPAGDVPYGFGVIATVSILNRTVGGLNELARSELDEAILA
jgi:hypothetical protein